MLGTGENVCCINVSYVECMNLLYIFFYSNTFFIVKKKSYLKYAFIDFKQIFDTVWRYDL